MNLGLFPRRTVWLVLLACLILGVGQAQTVGPFAPLAQAPADGASSQMPGKQRKLNQVHLIWMGGDDCPPCVVWRIEHLPKLQKTAVFKTVLFSYVPKSIRASVPSRFYLPEAVKPYKEILDQASAGRVGSPQVAVLVNGQVFDYFFGARSAEDMEEMLLAARDGGKYPFPRCLRLDAASRGCALKPE